MAFNKEGVPYEMRGGLRFFEQAHVKDVLAYLKVIANHKDEIAWQRLLLLQAGIGDVNAKKVFIVARELKDLADVLRLIETKPELASLIPPSLKKKLFS